MRLNQFISHYSSYSRREADSLIASGRVKIGHKVAKLGDSVERDQLVFIDSKLLKIKEHKLSTAIVYHKPKGELVSKLDDRGRKVIFDSLDKKFSHFSPVGRLDYASEGLLILSDDKKIVDSLMNSKLEREYILKISGKVSKEMIEAMENGLELEDARAGGHTQSKLTRMSFAPFVHFHITKNQDRFSRLKVCITEGKNRELRRFFAHFNAEVLDLRRVRYGFIELSALPVGKWRYLDRTEYNKLHEFMKESQKGKK